MATDTQFGFRRVQRNIEVMKIQLPLILANQAQNFFVDSWKKQGWDDGTVQAWATPQRRIRGTSAYKYPKTRDLGRRKRPTLVKTGALRRAVSNSVREKNFTRIRFLVELPYAAAHNDGTGNIPQRRFMGDSRTLKKMQLETINTAMQRIWQV